MKYLLQIDFPYTGPFKEQMTEAMKDLAKEISKEDGIIFKIWTENEDEKEAGGIYLFDNKNDANRYLNKHTKRLESFGIKDIRSKIFTVNKELSEICNSTFL